MYSPIKCVLRFLRLMLMFIIHVTYHGEWIDKFEASICTASRSRRMAPKRCSQRFCMCLTCKHNPWLDIVRGWMWSNQITSAYYFSDNEVSLWVRPDVFLAATRDSSLSKWMSRCHYRLLRSSPFSNHIWNWLFCLASFVELMPSPFCGDKR